MIQSASVSAVLAWWHRTGAPEERVAVRFFLMRSVFLLIRELAAVTDLRRRTVILHHQNGLYLRESLVKIKQIADICAAPCVDGLVRITDDEQILVVPHQHMHQLILECIDILELVDHNVFQAFLPLQPDLFLLLKDIEGKFDQIVVIEAEALLFLIEIAVKNDVGHFGGLKVFRPAAHRVASGSFPDSNRDT